MRPKNDFTRLSISRRRLLLCLATSASSLRTAARAADGDRPNIVLCMADDQGWGDVGYRGHPLLKTPILDEMASSGLRFERFYAAAPVCSPTRGSVLTGRHPNRYGCFSWGHTIRPQEVTIAEALRGAGYTTGHFGKWHVGSVRADSPVSPSNSGFDEWLSSPNFFENNPLLSRNGKVIQTRGEGSQVTVDAAIEFIRSAAARKQPFLAVVWFGSPHAPHEALDSDRRLYSNQPEKMQHFYGEITAMDRAIGNLRKELRRLRISDNTLFWYKSDNGAIPVGSTGGLSGGKGTLDEGGIRVPAIIEWPNRIRRPRISHMPSGTVDIYPTLIDITGAKVRNQVQPLDGISLLPLIESRMERRTKPLGFWVNPAPGIPVRSAELLRNLASEQSGQSPASNPPPDYEIGKQRYRDDNFPGPAAWIDGDYKLHRKGQAGGGVTYALFDLSKDPQEKADLAAREADRVARMRAEMETWQKSVVQSLNGGDYH